MKEGISNIKSSWDDLKFAEGTNNTHKAQTKEHKKLLQQGSSKNQSTCKPKKKNWPHWKNGTLSQILTPKNLIENCQSGLPCHLITPS